MGKIVLQNDFAHPKLTSEDLLSSPCGWYCLADVSQMT